VLPMIGSHRKTGSMGDLQRMRNRYESRTHRVHKENPFETDERIKRFTNKNLRYQETV